MSANTIEVLARNGITVDSAGKLEQDKSIQLYEDGHFFDFGENKQHYHDIDDLLSQRDDLIDSPVQAKKYSRSTQSTNWTPEILNGLHATHKKQIKDLDPSFYGSVLGALLPSAWFDAGNTIPDIVGYDFKHNTLTVSAMDRDECKAICYRRSMNANGKEVKWKTYGSKKFIPTRLTGKDDVYIASGMGELVMLEILGVDYICLQSDSMVNHLQGTPEQIQHLIILPDNDKSFLDKVDEIVAILAPKTASIVRWEHSDPRDAATVYGTPEALQTAIDENLETLKVVESEHNIIEHIHEPVDPVRFADKMKEVLIEYNDKFVVSEKMMDVFNSYCSTFNLVVQDNTNDDVKKRYIVPLATGSAKTTAAKVYLGANKSSGVLVVRTAMDAVKAVRDINRFAGGAIARCTYSIDAKNNRPDTAERVEADELINYPVIVLTHAMFQRLHGNTFKLDTYNTYLGETRKIIIIDERIDLKREESFDNLEVEDVIKILKEAGTIPEEYVESLEVVNELAFTHNKNLVHNSRFTMWKEGMIDVMKAGSELFTNMITILKSGNAGLTHIPRIRGLRKKESDMFEVENSVIDLLNRIYFVINGHMMLSKEGKKTVISRVEDYSLVFGSTVILDATANVNKSYEVYLKHQPESTVMFHKPEIRNYKNATLHIAKGFKQSKSALYHEPKKINGTDAMVNTVKLYLELIYPVVEKDDNMLIVVHKDALATFREQCRMDNITFTNWGRHAGSNEWNYYNKASIIGWYRLPQYLYANQINAGAKNYLNYEPSEAGYDADVSTLAASTISDDMIQFLNRIRSRIAVDEVGNHLPVDYYMFSDDTTGSKNIINTMVGEFKDMKVVDWSVAPATALKKRRPKAEERADNIIAILKSEAQNKSDVMAENIRTRLGTTRAAFNKTIKSEYMQKEMEYFNIKYTRLEGVSGKPSVFDLSEAKNL